MFKEIKYLIFVIVISLFIFINLKYYFSDTNKKKSFRSLSNFNDNSGLLLLWKIYINFIKYNHV